MSNFKFSKKQIEFYLSITKDKQKAQIWKDYLDKMQENKPQPKAKGKKKFAKIFFPIFGTLAAGGLTTGLVLGLSQNPVPVVTQDQKNIDKLNYELKFHPEVRTMYDAIKMVKQSVDIENIQAETPGSRYVWDQSANLFAVIDKDGKLQYGDKGYSLPSEDYKLWIMTNTIDSKCSYSQYLLDNEDDELDNSIVITNGGFDCGNYTRQIKSVTYNAQDESNAIIQDLRIRTNSIGTAIFINANNQGDKVSHYGYAGDMAINTNHTFTEFGHITAATISEGALIVDASKSSEEAAGTIFMIYVDKDGVTLKENNNGKITEPYKAKGVEVETDIEAEVQEELQSKFNEDKLEQIKKEAEVEDPENPPLPEVTNLVAIYNDETGEVVKMFDDIWDLADYSNTADEETEEYPTFKGQTIVLNGDIDFEESLQQWQWTPICDYELGNIFLGTFDGQGFSIKNFTLEDEGRGYNGFFGNFAGTIKNLTFKDCSNHFTEEWDIDYPDGDWNGIACAICYPYWYDWGTEFDINFENVNFENCTIESTGCCGFFGTSASGMDASQYPGWGFEDTRIKNISFKNCNIDKDSYIKSTGGAQAAGYMAQITVNVDDVKFDNCTNEANITGNEYVGGFLGQAGGFLNLEMNDCTNKGDIVCDSKLHHYDYLSAGGFLGDRLAFANTTKLNNCQNDGNVCVASKPTDWTPTGVFAGGLIGIDACGGCQTELTDCANNGNIGIVDDENNPISDYSAGMIGCDVSGDAKQTFTNCSNHGTIIGTNVGHLIANIHGSCIQQAINCISDGALVGERYKVEGEAE